MQENLEDILIKGNGRCRKTKIIVYYIFIFRFCFCFALFGFWMLSTVWRLCVWYLIYKVLKDEKEKSIKSAVRLLFSCFDASNVKIIACELHTEWIHPTFERFEDFLIIIIECIAYSNGCSCPLSNFIHQLWRVHYTFAGIRLDWISIFPIEMTNQTYQFYCINNVINSFIVHPNGQTTYFVWFFRHRMNSN